MPKGRPIKEYQRLLVIKLREKYDLTNAQIVQRVSLSDRAVREIINSSKEDTE